MDRKALVIGGDGMLGHKVFQVFSRRIETHASFLSREHYLAALPAYEGVDESRIHTGVNVLDQGSLSRLLDQARPDYVLNCVGLIKQLKEASDYSLAIRINSLLPHRLAELCSDCGSKLVHFSTDCVFSGDKGDYTEDDNTDATDLYGKSKALGEVDYGGHLTVRTSIIGREWVRDTALLEWFLSQRGRSVRGYRNAVYTGFTTEAIAELVYRTLTEHSKISGLWNVSSEKITKLDLLKRINDAWALGIDVQPFDDPPCDRSLDSSRFFSATGLARPTWDSMIARLVSDETPYEKWRRRNRGQAATS